MRMRRGAPALARSILIAGCGVLVGAGCACDTPESRVRKVIARAERAVEDRSTARAGELVSGSYADPSGNDNRSVLALLHLEMRRHDAIHLLIQVRDLAFPAAGKAEATVLVAMAGRDIDSLSALTGISADFYRFDVTLVEEDGDWRLVRAVWRRAVREDFH